MFIILQIFYATRAVLKIGGYLTIRPVAFSGYGSIAHEAKPNGLLTCGPSGRRVYLFGKKKKKEKPGISLLDNYYY